MSCGLNIPKVAGNANNECKDLHKNKYIICVYADEDCGKTQVANKVWIRLWRKAQWGKKESSSYNENRDHVVFLKFDSFKMGVVTIGDPESTQEYDLDRVARWDIERNGVVGESPEILICTARIERKETVGYKKPEQIVKDIAQKYGYEIIWYGNWHIDKDAILSKADKDKQIDLFNKMSVKAIIRTIENLLNVELFDF